MKKLEKFEKVGDVLVSKYHNAIKVSYKNGTLRDKDNAVMKKKTTLVYYKPSPDYCKRNEALGLVGVKDRVCESNNQVDFEKCKELCNGCGFKMKLKIITRIEKCNCKFQWCCFVKCEECKKQVVVATCEG